MICYVMCRINRAQYIDISIDMQIGNKFNAFKQYADKYDLHWGFVRDINEELFINNTVFVDDMSDDSWGALSEKF